MDYSKMSDFEINKRVLEAKSGFSALSYPHDADKRSCGHKDINGNYHWFDFCNDPADAWPIITGNMIALIPSSLKDGRWAAQAEDWDYAHSSEKPLRAAMIVYLQLQDAK